MREPDYFAKSFDYPCDGCGCHHICAQGGLSCDVYTIWENTGVMPLSSNLIRIPHSKWFEFGFNNK